MIIIWVVVEDLQSKAVIICCVVAGIYSGDAVCWNFLNCLLPLYEGTNAANFVVTRRFTNLPS